MSDVGTIEELRTLPERWEFLLRVESGEGVNVELRGEIHGTLRVGDRVELLESRPVHAHGVVIASRLRNETLNSTVTATRPGWQRRTATFLMPQNIWGPLGGFGGAALTLLFTADGNDKPSAAPATPPPISAPDDMQSPPLGLIALGVLAVGVVLLCVWFLTREGRSPRPVAPNVVRLGVYVLLGVAVGLCARLVID